MYIYIITQNMHTVYMYCIRTKYAYIYTYIITIYIHDYMGAHI